MEGSFGYLVPADLVEGQGEEVPSGAGLRGRGSRSLLGSFEVSRITLGLIAEGLELQCRSGGPLRSWGWARRQDMVQVDYRTACISARVGAAWASPGQPGPECWGSGSQQGTGAPWPVRESHQGKGRNQRREGPWGLLLPRLLWAGRPAFHLSWGRGPVQTRRASLGYPNGP